MFKRTFLCFQIKEDSLSQIIDDGRQILTFKIPLDVSGAAGLGLSVKGKARAVGGNDRDSPMENGIFVKSVIAGGAAAKVGDRSEEISVQRRLKVAGIVAKSRTELYSVQRCTQQKCCKTSCRGDMLHRAILQQLVLQRRCETSC